MTVADALPSRLSRPTPRDWLGFVMWKARLLVQRRLAWIAYLKNASAGDISGVRGGQPLWEATNLEEEDAWLERHPMTAELVRWEMQRVSLGVGPIDDIGECLGLTRIERETLEVLLGLTVNGLDACGLAALHPYESTGYASEELIAHLLGEALPLFTDASALIRWGLVRRGEEAPGVPRSLSVDPHVLALARGRQEIDPVLLSAAESLEVREASQSWPVAETASEVERALGRGTPVRVVVLGSQGSGRSTFAACVAHQIGRKTLAMNTTLITDSDWPQLYLRAQRQAILAGLTIVWRGEQVGRRPPRTPGVGPVEFLVAERDFVPSPVRGLATVRVVLPRLTLDERRAMWLRLVPESRTWNAHAFTEIVERYSVQVADIVTVEERGIVSAAQAQARCLEAHRGRLGDLGQLLECPFERTDLILSSALDRAVDDLLYEARERTRFWQDPKASRLFPRGRGLVALLGGPPGTGKTMTAQVIARTLGLDLVRIDLATTVSKYIGETAKNLKQIFDRAEDMNAVLLFDEADALFTKRTEVRDAHDRYANADTNYLLQLLENYAGIAFLASNRRQNIDTAFVRRIRYVLDFPRPTAAERHRIWLHLLGELFPAEDVATLTSVVDTVAARLELSGAQIKLSVLTAAFLVRKAGGPLLLEHLLTGVERELGKEGRSISGAERQVIQSTVQKKGAA